MTEREIKTGMRVLRKWLEKHDNPDRIVALPSSTSCTPRNILEALEKRVADGYERRGDILDYILEAASKGGDGHG